MKQNEIILMKWVYTPKDFFEEKETSLLSDIENTIENGEITVYLNDSQNFPGIQEKLQEQLFSIFRGAALVNQKPFTIEYCGQETTNSDDRRLVILHVDFAVKMSMEVDYLVKDQNDNIIVDTKLERQSNRRRLATLAAKYQKTDPIIDSILSSYEKSLNYPSTALVHLYEIRDALSKKFSGEKEATKKLNISKSKWS